MGRLQVLDCTLRDGGYCNQWQFGRNNIKKITEALTEAGVDVIECGFLTNRITYNPDVSKFTAVEELASVIPKNRRGKRFVCMMNYGEYDAEDIPDYDGKSVDGIRVAFHKKDLTGALKICSQIKEKGYNVFIQAMVSLNYSDEEFLDLIKRVNELSPYSFYIVDSFGVMKRKDLVRLFYMVEHNLHSEIAIGYHSHNNMQLAYSNAQTLVDMRTDRELIIDSSVFGMGRGAGNLNTELFVKYLNDNIGSSYELKPLLAIIDEILSNFYAQNYWGYSLPNYLSAKHNTHPNYAGYLDQKKTLTVEAIDEIFEMMDDSKRASYDKEYIEDLYVKYMEQGITQGTHISDLQECIGGKTVLIIAPGSSSRDEQDKVIKAAQEKEVVSIGINFDYSAFYTDFIFLSNLRRFRELDPAKKSKCIVTSNIPAVEVYLKTPYKELVNDVEAVRDNAGLMLVKFLINLKAEKILIAGLDGYSSDPLQNFADKEMSFFTQYDHFQAMNKGLNQVLTDYKQYIDIEYVTTPKHVII